MRCSAVAVVCALTCLARAERAPGVETHAGRAGNSTVADEVEVAVSAVTFAGGARDDAGAALAAVVRGVVAARGVRARVVPPAPACAVSPDARACLEGTLASLARGDLQAAVVPAPRAPPPPRLRDAGLEEVGDAAPPAHRACFSRPPAAAAGSAPPPRSLLDFADARLAALYHLSRLDIERALGEPPRYECSNSTNASEPSTQSTECSEEPLATLLTDTASEVSLLRDVIREHGLHAHAVAVGAQAARALQALSPRAAVLCGRALDPARLARLGARALGPPPCLRTDCPFEARRLIKLVNARALARSPGAARALARIALDEGELRALGERARADGPEAAARGTLAAHPEWTRAAVEVRVAVMIPATTRRDSFDAVALRAAAELAEADEAAEGAASRRDFDFKAELLDDACSGSRAFKHLTDALGSEFGALSGVAGPACGAAFGDVTRQSAGLALPVLAYTAQAPPAEEAARLTLLAAGDARREVEAWAALLARLRWRRVAVLSELATRAALDPARLGADVVVHVELPAAGDTLDTDLVHQWVSRVVRAGLRVGVVCVEDARAARAALCAARAAGLELAWVLPAALPPRWLRAADDLHNCSGAELAAAAEGYLSAAPAWEAPPPAAWAARWRARCPLCRAPPPPAAALLYDTLRLWAAALARLLRATPAAADDLHRDDLLRSLVADAVGASFTGVTGAFEWEQAGGARARAGALVLRQWRNNTHVVVGEWRRGHLALHEAALRWQTADGRAPDDGAERCALQALADALHAECRVALAAVAALLLAALAALLAAAAWQCRRRAEREYRARLHAALDMRALSPKPAGGLDRWEVPRERVVINRKLGTGAFGTVYGGHALLAEGRGWTAVAVKTLKAGATTDEKLDFLSEAEAMKRFDHKNVVRLLGVVTATEPVCTVMEFMLYGDLKSYLLARRQLAGASDEVSPARLTSMALDVARALSYLAQLRYVHRDVAARNCLVSARRVVKLADFGMTRLVFEHDYYRFSRKGMLPVRWMAPESLALGVFSPASDVWSFGVLLYEIVTFGSLPFQGLSNAEVLARVKAGHTLDLPPGIKPQLEALIKSCWRQERRLRPRAASVCAALADAPRLLAPCLDVPLDALPLALEPAAARDEAQARWVSWAAPLSAATDSTYLSAEGAPRETDAFLPHTPPPP